MEAGCMMEDGTERAEQVEEGQAKVGLALWVRVVLLARAGNIRAEELAAKEAAVEEA